MIKPQWAAGHSVYGGVVLCGLTHTPSPLQAAACATAALPSVHDARIRFDGLYHFRIGVRRPGGVVVQALSLPSCLAHDGVRWEPESSKNACVCPRQSASNYLPWDLLVMNELAFFLLVAPTDELVYLQVAAPCLRVVEVRVLVLDLFSLCPYLFALCLPLAACVVVRLELVALPAINKSSSPCGEKHRPPYSQLRHRGVHPENPRELLDVPHILRKLKRQMRIRYEDHFSEQKARAFQSAISLPRLHQTGLKRTKKEICCQ